MRKKKKAKTERVTSDSKILIIEDNNKSARSLVSAVRSAVPEVDFSFLKSTSELEPKFFGKYAAILGDIDLLEDIDLSKWSLENEPTELHRAAADKPLLFYSSAAKGNKVLSEKLKVLPFKPLINH